MQLNLRSLSKCINNLLDILRGINYSVYVPYITETWCTDPALKNTSNLQNLVTKIVL